MVAGKLAGAWERGSGRGFSHEGPECRLDGGEGVARSGDREALGCRMEGTDRGQAATEGEGKARSVGTLGRSYKIGVWGGFRGLGCVGKNRGVHVHAAARGRFMCDRTAFKGFRYVGTDFSHMIGEAGPRFEQREFDIVGRHAEYTQLRYGTSVWSTSNPGHECGPRTPSKKPQPPDQSSNRNRDKKYTSESGKCGKSVLELRNGDCDGLSVVVADADLYACDAGF